MLFNEQLFGICDYLCNVQNEEHNCKEEWEIVDLFNLTSLIETI